jgi:hypothetical protein
MTLGLPLVISILSALGFGFLTYEGVSALTTNLVSVAQANLNGFSGDLLQIVTGVTTKAAVTATKKFLPK